MAIHLNATNFAAGTPDGVDLASRPGCLSKTHQPNAATQATVTAAAVTDFRHIARRISFSVACAATKQGPVAVNLRDGATGAGTILKSWKVSTPADTSVQYTEEVDIIGTAATALTLEFAAANVANSEATVNLEYQTVPA